MIKFLLSDRKPFNIWYVSDYGSDDNDCHSASASCWNLQTVLDRATDGADIYVTSDTLSLDGFSCYISSPLSYTISHLHNRLFEFTYSGLCAYVISNTVFRSFFLALSI